MRNRVPRILYVVPTWPHEKSYGQQLRVLHVGRALQNVGEVSLAIVSNSNDAAAMAKTAIEFQVYCNLRAERPSHRGSRDRLRWWLDPCFMDSYWSFVGEGGKGRIVEGSGYFDLIWLNCL